MLHGYLMRLKINLKKANNLYVKQLIDFFRSESEKGIKIWKKDKSYFFRDGSKFALKHDVFERKRKEGKPGVYYEVISNKDLIGYGAFGKVAKISRTLSIDDQGINPKISGERVVKIQEHTVAKNPLSVLLEREYKLSVLAGHLGVKEPTITGSCRKKYSYTVMKRLPGRDLHDVMASDLSGKETLSTQRRVELSRALLYALNEQVTSKGIIHRDIKPCNIIVNLSHPIQVNIIDYGLSTDVVHPLFRINGTRGYFSPEAVKNPLSVSVKSDVFSMARVIAQIWHVDLDFCKSYKSTESEIRKKINKVSDLDEDSKNKIITILLGMLKYKQKDRFSIEDSINRVNLIRPSINMSLSEMDFNNCISHDYPINRKRKRDLKFFNKNAEMDFNNCISYDYPVNGKKKSDLKFFNKNDNNYSALFFGQAQGKLVSNVPENMTELNGSKSH